MLIKNTPRRGRWRQKEARRRMLVEKLEDRRVLATVTWDGGAGTESWFDAANWDNDVVPQQEDDVVVPSDSGRIRFIGGQNFNPLGSHPINSLQVNIGSILDIRRGTLDIANASTIEGELRIGIDALNTQGSQISGDGSLLILGTMELHPDGRLLNIDTEVATDGTFEVLLTDLRPGRSKTTLQSSIMDTWSLSVRECCNNRVA